MSKPDKSTNSLSKVPAIKANSSPGMLITYVCVVILMSLGWYFGTKLFGGNWSLFQSILITILTGIVFQIKSVIVCLNAMMHLAGQAEDRAAEEG